MLERVFFMPKNYLRVSESVCAGHPDKLADQISDAVLDTALSQDKDARVALETLVAKDLVVMAGEITTKAQLDYQQIAKKVIRDNGYIEKTWGFGESAEIKLAIHHQSPEIAVGVGDDTGAGDQGMCFGYATNETASFMPLPIVLAHELTRKIDESRKSSELKFLRPDGKAQVVLKYENDRAVSIEHITIAVPHDEAVPLEEVRQKITRNIIEPVVASHGLSLPEEIIINGTGVWHNPGPASDVGLTGRKIIVDTYGGAAKAGGGAFSGKDPSKVDRSGAYAARFIAKNIVASGLADRAEVCLAFYIVAPRAIIKQIDTFGTAKKSDALIGKFADSLIDCSVKNIIDQLDLKNVNYKDTSTYGHFGKPNYPWEEIVQVKRVV